MEQTTRAKRTYLLVHGGGHGAWCFYKVIAGLERAGQKVIAPDLPGMGTDRTPYQDVTLDLWARSISNIIEKEPNPVILVGHSRGGLVCSQAAEYCYDKIAKLVYIASTLIKSGESFMENSLVGPSPSSSKLASSLAADGLSAKVSLDNIKEVFYHDCPEEDVALARSSICAEPLLPWGAPVTLTEEHYWRVPKVYISTLQDRLLEHAVQKKLYTWAKCERVIEMNTSHSPFFSAPDELVANLLSI
jgi:pimeloyl-ACP methyl ester carboxylesterase